MTNINALIEELKKNNEDFEFYPTTKLMIEAILKHLNDYCQNPDILDIGAGTENFKIYHNELKNKEQKIKNYYVIEKAKTLIDRFDKDTIVLGTDFNCTTLIDKPVDVIFCNPPYSEFENWTKRIIFESNCKYIYLIIPERWKENKEITKIIEDLNLQAEIIQSFDFLEADRPARANVDVLFINKNPESKNRWCRHELSEINEDAFSKFFDETFKFRDKVSDYENATNNDSKKEKIKTQLIGTESKAKMLVTLYENEQKKLFEHFTAISDLDLDVLKTIGISKQAVKEALKQKIKSLKILYWTLVFEELDEITSRLTYKTREKMLNRFKSLLTVDFTIENIYPLIVWIIKNANGYYNEQLIEFFIKLSDVNNIKPYKSNQKTFKFDKWRHNNTDEDNRYTLDYRIICSYMFGTLSYSKRFDDHFNEKLIDDICTIANNLGFEAPSRFNRPIPKEFGKKYYIYCASEKNDILFEYKIYKNNNTHIKLNKEFAKALNVEVSRLLGWIKCKEDIKKEFDEEMFEGAEKYFKANTAITLQNPELKLLGVSN